MLKLSGLGLDRNGFIQMCSENEEAGEVFRKYRDQSNSKIVKKMMDYKRDCSVIILPSV